MNVQNLRVGAVIAFTVGVMPLQVAAAGEPAGQLLGLWQSSDSFLELNIDGTFFTAEQLPENDLFGTYVVHGNVVRFTYSLGESLLTTEKIVSFGPAAENKMQLLDNKEQAVSYQKLRDF